MLCKLYKQTSKSADAMEAENARMTEFNELYKKHGVNVVGGGTNVDNPLESYFMTMYKDAAHYEETVKKLQADSKYQELTKELQNNRANIEVVTLDVPDEMTKFLQ